MENTDQFEYPILKLNDFDHNYILCAYLSRLSLYDMERLTEIKRQGVEASLNGNNNEQLETSLDMLSECSKAIGRMLEYDKDRVTEVINLISKRNTKMEIGK